MTGAAPSVSAVLVNFRTPEMTLDCVKSLAGHCRALPAEIIIVFVLFGAFLERTEALISTGRVMIWNRNVTLKRTSPTFARPRDWKTKPIMMRGMANFEANVVGPTRKLRSASAA